MGTKEFKPYLCYECGEPCNGTTVDDGIGPYEFWGVMGIDKQERFASECCEAELIDDDGDLVDYPFDEEEERIH